MITVFTDARIFDGISEDLLENGCVVVEDERIREIASTTQRFPGAQVIDCSGRFLMPGLIDAHFHAYTPSFDVAKTDRMPQALLVSHATAILEGALQRGF